MSNRWRITVDTDHIPVEQWHLTMRAIAGLSLKLLSMRGQGFAVEEASYLNISTITVDPDVSAIISHTRASAITTFLLTKTLPEGYSIESLD